MAHALDTQQIVCYTNGVLNKTMPQFTLICTDDDSTVTTKEFEATVLDDVVDKTQDFLKGVGYCFEELHTQVYPIPETSDTDDYTSVYRDVD